MSRSTRRSTTSIKYPGWILLQTEATPLGKSLINLNAPRWYHMGMCTRELKSLSGRLRVMIRKTKFFLTGMFFLKAAFSRCRSWMFDNAWGDLDWISEEKYNLIKEKIMPKKKKKAKKKKKKAKAKKKKKR